MLRKTTSESAKLNILGLVPQSIQPIVLFVQGANCSFTVTHPTVHHNHHSCMCSSSMHGAHHNCIGKDAGPDQLSHTARLGTLHTCSNLECPCKVAQMVHAAHAVHHSAEKTGCQQHHPDFAEQLDNHSHLWRDCHEDQRWEPADHVKTWQDSVQGWWAV